MSDQSIKNERPPQEPEETLDPPEVKVEAGERKYLRFSVFHRIEHWIFAISFIVLGLTGLIQKFSSSPVSVAIITGLGGIESTRVIHRVAATIMMVVVVYHLGAVIYRLYIRRLRPTMLPSMYDVRAAIGSLAYYLGLRKTRPQQGRYTFEEKAEYWAVVWGTVIMVITGFMLWNPLATTRFLPGDFIPAARAAHGGEALLAVLAIILWHMYHVVIRHFNPSMFTGYVSEETMLEEHPIELADIKAGLDKPQLDPRATARRRRIFFPLYSVVAAVLLAGIALFVSFEETAIATHPPAEEVEVFVPLPPTPLPTLPPTPTSVPQAEATSAPGEGTAFTWTGGIADLFASKCGACHGSAQQLGGLDLSTYASALEVINPGVPEASQLVIVQAAGGHPGQLSTEELETVREWIAAGAPE